MKDILDSISKAIENENWYAALFNTMTLPDICVSLEHGKTTGNQYAAWFDENLPQYNKILSGSDCYALRCALLHEGKDNTES